ncbi:MAG TPA: S-adenosylmethionine:tRNA ribosyltransferase-isomerase [Candidatus Baltobacteraceae bacterium]|nr:S-adenosylmethionine:tRNA ribosyltransferase-isomerase [Candidatus Baltobacteraceae bacterium]
MRAPSAASLVIPAGLEAAEPPELRGIARDGVRLLVSDSTSGNFEHRSFAEFPALLRRGDLVVVNDSATLPAALDAWTARGRHLVLHCSTHVAATLWIVEPRDGAGQGMRPLPEPERSELTATRLILAGGGIATLLAPVDERSSRLWYARLELGDDGVEHLHAFGRPIRYAYAGAFPIGTYQTIFARVPGSAEMPSAARPFTPRTLAALEAREIEVASITLHTGVSSQESHEPPFAERYAVPQRAVDAIARAKERGGRIVAVGTTVVRALESAVQDGVARAAAGWTERLVAPERPPEIVDGLLTGLHEPQASHLEMLAAFLPEPALAQAYREALREQYLWHEFGDTHLILPRTQRRFLVGLRDEAA